MKSKSEALLSFYKKFHGRRPTVLQAFARQPLSYWLGILLLFSVAGGYCYFMRDLFSWVMFGTVAGALARDIGWILSFRRNWPTLDRVLDWQLIEQELSKTPSADS